MEQAVQMVGALIVLSGFIANQWFGLPSNSVRFLLANFLGTAILTGCAAANRDAGFILVEGVWAIVSFVGLVRALLAAAPTRPAPA